MSENRNSFIEATKATDERLEALKQLYPELFSDGKINLDVLKEITGGENPQEERTPGYYGLYWPGKRKAKIEAKASPKGTLVPVPGDGVNEDTTHNIYIEGDNLEVLRILKQSYKGRVKMIYIDPPYNTGNDFIYPDDYTMPVEEYKRLTGQTDEKGNVLTTNLKSNGAFHTKWLNMMLPRLMLARDLLTDEGVIFISIDDNEQANLRLLCDDIFGEENFIANIIWQNKKGGGNDSKYMAIEHEYVLVYAKDTQILKEFYELYSPEYIKRYKEEDEVSKFYWDTFKRKSGKQYYPITCPDGTVLQYDDDGNPISWLRSEERFKSDLKIGDVRIVNLGGKWSVQFKQRIPLGKTPRSIFTTNTVVDDKGTTSTGSDDTYKYFKKDVFSNPKPVDLLNFILGFGLQPNEICLDFFSGSGTLAESLMKLNLSDNGHRKFLLVQIQENIDNMLRSPSENAKRIAENAISVLDELKKRHYITELAKERIRRAGEKVLEEAKANKDMFSEENPLDIGFKVYRMQESNFKEYKPVQGQDENATKSLFEELENNQIPLVDGWKTENVLTEIILKQGFALDCDCKKVDAFTKNTVYCIKDSKGPASRTTTMYVCLDSQIDSDTIKNLKLDEKEKFVCLNSAIDDTSYARLADKGRIETI
ncbi:MAG: site-specific DNA-methyltransferase [Clostridia bacterium]|nr:site-specific DNA-methyltransferase [Clostridia bacterium]